eukprot:gnl/TRDRNA2_/TRDRNA2_93614_c0_seq2.p1 gnl/TRDRNA2_/TRDRNA2_93614_c0~~gnl/TRDRNA2_/TRDRNA2_93614_c0_seq2.p1  ORF type:complete len:106 (+),score=23.75 gnl/TRDRNA2_/TRDRNA2_93614_c0_seq2:3-320(+)
MYIGTPPLPPKEQILRSGFGASHSQPDPSENKARKEIAMTLVSSAFELGDNVRKHASADLNAPMVIKCPESNVDDFEQSRGVARKRGSEYVPFKGIPPSDERRLT